MKVVVGDPAPILGAEVFLDEFSVGLTGADGSLVISEVTAGSHTIRAHKEGYYDASATIDVPATTSVTLTITTIPPPPPPPPQYITIGVKVTEEDGTPIAGAGVQVGGVGGVWDTGSDGIAWISEYPKDTTGSIRVATLDGRSAYDAHTFTYDREVFTITVPPAPIEITARARVKWPDGTPIPNVRIHFDTVDVRTDYYGRASFRVIKDKPYWVNIDNPRGWTETFYAMVWAYNYQEIGFTLRWTY